MVYCSVTCTESEGDKEETVEQSEQSQQDMSQVRVSANAYPLLVRNQRTCTCTHIFFFLHIFGTHIGALVSPKNDIKYS